MTNNMHKFRMLYNVRQKDVADACNLSMRTYGSYENGEREPSLETLCRLADYFNVTIDELLGRTTASQLFDDARVERPEILELYEGLTPELQERALAYMHGLADMAAVQSGAHNVVILENRRNRPQI